MKIKIKIKEDLRVLKGGSEYEFDFSGKSEPFIYITGKNGCGKSTLINCVRVRQCDNEGEDRSGWGAKLGYGDLFSEDFEGKSEVETDFEKIYFLSSEFDDPKSLNNCASAESYVEYGGYMNRHKSNGESELNLLGKWLVDNRDKFNDKTLIIFDEIDKGLSLEWTVGVVNMMNKLHEQYGVYFLCIVHNVIPLLMAKNDIYVMGIDRYVNGKVYIYVQTGKYFTYIKEEEEIQKEICETLGKS